MLSCRHYWLLLLLTDPVTNSLRGSETKFFSKLSKDGLKLLKAPEMWNNIALRNGKEKEEVISTEYESSDSTACDV